MGRRARNAGNATQGMVAIVNNVYENNGLCVVIEPGTRCERRGGKLRELPSTVDCIIVAGGFDVKHVSGYTYRHSKAQIHQLWELWRFHQAGLPAFLLVEVGVGEWFIVWARAAWDGCTSFSVNLKTGEGVQPCPLTESGLPDWLARMPAESE